ncbi:MAG: malate synthase A [Parachlamydiaceae bacterium]
MIDGPFVPVQNQILTRDAIRFLEQLHTTFEERRQSLLEKRKIDQIAYDKGALPSFLETTEKIRSDLSWRVAPIPPNLEKRWVEITGPVERKMMINALNSGADVFMADFEDSLSPTWPNVIEGQANLIDAVRKKISFTSPEGKTYFLKDQIATLMVRPRGLHLKEKHLSVDDQSIAGAFFDFGLYVFHNAHYLVANGLAPYFYLPKLESHEEAHLWNDIFIFAQDYLGIPQGTFKSTVLIETIPAAFEMEEILFELKEHCLGLNAGRWDYIFSIIKKFAEQDQFLLPDRNQITMTTEFMQAYTKLLVNTCHKRGAHAIGGMAAFIPSRKDPEINQAAISKVQADKLRETREGFDGTWVAHPDLVPIAEEAFKAYLHDQPHQKEHFQSDLLVTAEELLYFVISDGKITEEGLRSNISVALQYIESWLRGQGAVAISNLMEDAATAEISRSQVWQWIRHGATLPGDRLITHELVQVILKEERRKRPSSRELDIAAGLLAKIIGKLDFTEFFTLLAYEQLD